MPNRLLSKTKYLNGMQCLKFLWLIFNDPSKIPPPDDRTQAIFDQGHLVGDLAKTLYPGGIDIHDEDIGFNLKRTKELLPERKTLFEAGFATNRLYARVDILKPAVDNSWDIIEVKSSTEVKDENLQDVSFQKLVLENSGLKINQTFLAFLNKDYVRHGEIDPSALFTIKDITDDVVACSEGIQDRLQIMFDTISSSECPLILFDGHCGNPHDCPVTFCREELPDNNILNLYRGGKKSYELLYNGVRFLKDIPSGYKLSPVQQIQKSCDIDGKPCINKPAIKEFLAQIEPPVHYLDFETINPAVPLFDNSSPYQQIPFQFSLHIVEANGETVHYSYLADGTNDPRPQLVAELKKHVKDEGSIITYNQPFEQGRLQETAEAFPECTGWVDDTCSRMVDLLQPFRSFHYYNPLQCGSAGLKAVLPAITGKGYDGMPIADGGAASRAFLDVTYGEVSEDERARVRADLEKYCGLDTEGMIWIVEKLNSLV